MANPRGQKPRFDHAKAIEMYADPAATFQQVADVFKVSAPAVYAIVRKKAPHLLGQSRRRGRPVSFDSNAAIAMYAKGGVSYKEVGEAFDVSPSTIHNLIKRAAPHLRKSVKKAAS